MTDKSLSEQLWKSTLQPGDRVGYFQDRERYRYIEIVALQDGLVEVRTNDGVLAIYPRYSNSIYCGHSEQ